MAPEDNSRFHFSRPNLLSLIAGLICIVSSLLPWWGIDQSGFGGSTSGVSWSLWSQPSVGSNPTPATLQTAQTLAVLSNVVLVLVLINAGVVLLGSFSANTRLLSLGFLLGIGSLLDYYFVVSYTLTSICQGSSNCPVSQPVGSLSVIGTTVAWGFQTGFYLLIAANTLVVVSIVFHKGLLRLLQKPDNATG